MSDNYSFPQFLLTPQGLFQQYSAIVHSLEFLHHALVWELDPPAVPECTDLLERGSDYSVLPAASAG